MGNSSSKKASSAKASSSKQPETRPSAPSVIQYDDQGRALPPPGAMGGAGIRDPVQLSEDPAAGELADGRELQPEKVDPSASVATQDDAISFWDKGKTFRPQRIVPDSAAGGKGGRIMRTVQATMKATLGGGDLQQAVKVPPGEDKFEWLAVNTVQFYNAGSLIYGTVAQYCTAESCPTMAAGKAEYLWKDESNPLYKRPTRLPAPQYIDLMMSAIDAQITDPEIFPVEENVKFPRNFLPILKQIYKRLFRLYAHIYCAHHDKIRAIGASAHLNTCFKHFVYFIQEFDLVSKAEMQPLEKLIARFTDKGASSGSQ